MTQLERDLQAYEYRPGRPNRDDAVLKEAFRLVRETFPDIEHARLVNAALRLQSLVLYDHPHRTVLPLETQFEKLRPAFDWLLDEEPDLFT